MSSKVEVAEALDRIQIRWSCGDPPYFKYLHISTEQEQQVADSKRRSEL